jgi:hypothetical protein
VDEVDPEPVADDRRRLIERVVGDDPLLEELVADTDCERDEAEKEEGLRPSALRDAASPETIRRACGVRFARVQ